MGSNMSSLGKAGELAVAIGVPLGCGFGIGMWTAPEVKTWYKKIKKPTWNPPNWLFGPVWSVLYISQGIASWLVYREGGIEKNKLALGLYAAQLLVNLAWNPLFFKAKRLDLAMADIIAMDILVAATICEFKDVIGVPATAGLLGPYAAWISFATVLNGWLLAHNPRPTGVAEDAEPLLDDAASTIKGAAEEAKKGGKEAVKSAKKATKDTVEQAKKTGEEVRKTGDEAADETYENVAAVTK